MNISATSLEYVQEPTSETTVVTPDLAKDWLTKENTAGRLNKRLVSAYAAEMRAHKWKLNGEPIIFSESGDLLAGRHRLWACLEAQTAFPTLVVRGVPAHAFDTIDTLRRRTMGDVLTIRQLPSGRSLSAGLNLIWRCYRGDLDREKLRVPIQEALNLLNVYPDLKLDKGPNSSIDAARAVTKVIPHGMGIGFHFIFSRILREKADQLFEQIVETQETGEITGPGGVLYVTFKQLQESGGRRDPQRMRAYIIKAWNALHDERPLSQLKFAGNEKFPSISGLNVAEHEENSSLDRPDEEQGIPQETLRELSVEFVEVTPERAKALLENNPVNRAPATAVVSRYARDMKSGDWKVNGQTIKVASNGRLIDGQHRLKACIEAGRSFPALIVGNVDEDAFDTFDLGAKKSYAIVLSERGEQNTAALAAALKWVWLHERNRIGARTDQPTSAELDDVLYRHNSIRESLSYINKIRHLVAPGIGVSMHHLCSQVSRHHADEFFDRLVDGIGLTADSPVYSLREKLMRERLKERRSAASEQDRIVWIIKSWNAFVTEKPIKNISWRRKGANPEDVPSLAVPIID